MAAKGELKGTLAEWLIAGRPTLSELAFSRLAFTKSFMAQCDRRVPPTGNLPYPLDRQILESIRLATGMEMDTESGKEVTP